MNGDPSRTVSEEAEKTSRGITVAPEPIFQVLSFQPGKSTLQARRYQKRRTHKKSKAGCLGCKVKRVKCDEAKPVCARCLRNNVFCSYPSDESEASPSSQCRQSGSSPNETIPATNQTSLMTENRLSPPVPLDTIQHSPYGTPRLALLHHFQNLFTEITVLGSTDFSEIVSLGLSRPYLLSAIFAVSASHLRHNTPNPSPPYHIAEHFQQSLAIRNFQTALAQPLDQQAADALLLTSMLLNLLSFSMLMDEDPGDSWVFSRGEGRLNWFALNLGLKPLLYATEEYRENTILQWMYESSDDDQQTFHGESHDLTGVPSLWLKFCNLDASTPTEHVFFEPLRILAVLRNLPPINDTFFLYLGFFGTLDVEFRRLLEGNDERAMWILGYWFGLLCRFEGIWWMRARARRDYRAICLWLRQRWGGNDVERDEEQMRRELMNYLSTVTVTEWNGIVDMISDVVIPCDH
ncbi:Zn(2)-C6 fungal-type transcription factor afumD [Cladobotryum mycophilum]|uniref:Zn(2)-C6 fungal-type transcription factor afumD n=1 Tax=Cladobotryum mycophilum TaxID=491253 RepID=A0ABR0SB82_9HYPO